MKKIILISLLGLIIWGCEKSNSNATSDTGGSLINIDICRCLSEPGNTQWSKENLYVCRDAISARLEVENWEAVSLDPEVSKGLDRLARECAK